MIKFQIRDALGFDSAGNYMLKGNNRNTRISCFYC